MKKIIIIILSIAIVLGGGYYIYDKNYKQAKAPEIQENSGFDRQNSQASPTITPTPTPTAKPTTQTNTGSGTFSSGEEGGEGSDIQVKEISYDGSKFTPSSVEIKVNDWVFFKNNSKGNFWPASSPHPAHTDYPEFDAKKSIASGQTFKFQFTKAGVWKFHDHLNPSAFGSVTVK